MRRSIHSTFPVIVPHRKTKSMGEANRKVFRFKDLYKHQRDAIIKLKNSPHALLEMATGSGKSFCVQWLSGIELLQDKKRKVIIAVPQKVISSSFTKNIVFDYGDGNKVSCFIAEDHTKESKRGAVDGLIRFLETPPDSDDPEGRRSICCHQSLVILYRRLKRENKLHLLNNVSVYPDEAHHVLMPDLDMDEQYDQQLGNGLGQACKFIIQNENNGSRLRLTTATFHRGDGKANLPKEVLSVFEKNRYIFPIDEYLKWAGLDIFMHVVLCSDPWDKETRNLIKDGKIRDDAVPLIRIPATGSSFSLGSRSLDIDGAVSIYGKDKTVDLATFQTQTKNKNSVIELAKLQDNNRCAFENSHKAIVCQNVGLEGMDVPCLNTTISVGMIYSSVVIKQMMGRPLRKYPGKQRADFFMLVPASFKADKESERERVHSWFKATAICQVISQECSVPRLTIPRSKGSSDKTRLNFVYWKKVFQDRDEWCKFREDVNREMAVFCDTDPAPSKNEKRIELDAVVSEQLENRGLSDKHADKMAEMLWRSDQLAMALNAGINPDDLTFDILDRYDPYKEYNSIGLGFKEYGKIRDIVIGNRITMEDCHALAAERGGECLGVVEY